MLDNQSLFGSKKARFELGSIHKPVDLESNFKVRFINELNLSTLDFDSIVREQVRIMIS